MHAAQAQREQIRYRIRRKQTLTKNPESLNAKLLTNATQDPFFCKMNTFVGEIMRPNRMLMNLLPPIHNGNAGFSLNSLFWDSSDREATETFHNLIEISQEVEIQDATLRLSLIDYKITRNPYEEVKVAG